MKHLQSNVVKFNQEFVTVSTFRGLDVDDLGVGVKMWLYGGDVT